MVRNFRGYAVSAGMSVCMLVASPAFVEGAERVVLISIDGLTATDAAELGTPRFDAPNLRALMLGGARADGVLPTTPSNTFPNHVTMVTGVSAATHGIYDNDRFSPDTDQHGLHYHYYSDIRSPTLFDATRDAGRTSMAIWWPVTTGAPVDHLLADVPGDVRERGKYVFASATRDIRRVLENPEKAAEVTDALRLEAAIAGLDGSPDFTAIHFTELDAAQHDFGAGSPEALAVLARTDRYLGQFLDELETRGLREGAAIVVVSDHGFSPLHTAIFPGRLFRAYGLLELDDRGNLESWDAYPWPGGGALAVYVNPESDGSETVRRTVDHVIDVLASNPESFVHAVYRGNEMTRWGGYPDAYALINLKDGYAFGGDLDSVLIRSGTQTKGIHGFVPDRSGTYGALILSGAGIEAGARLEAVRMEDIAPTIAKLLGFSLPTAEGRALTRALANDLQ